MKIGGLVETVANFEELRELYGFPYPKKGDVLTVSDISRHPNRSVSRKGIVLLSFEELPELMGVCDRKVNGDWNFRELVVPDDLLEEVLELEFTL